MTEENVHRVPEHKEPIGPIVGIIVIVLVLTIGAMYYVATGVKRDTSPLPLISSDPTEAATSSSPFTP